jgi:hypothetical protein
VGFELRWFFRVVCVEVRLSNCSVIAECAAGWTLGAACTEVSAAGSAAWAKAAPRRMTATSRSLPGGKVMGGIFSRRQGHSGTGPVSFCPPQPNDA